MGKNKKIEVIYQNINDIQECIEYSNYPLMEECLRIFMTNYTGALMDIVNQCVSDSEKLFFTSITSKILEAVKSNDIFRIMDNICFELKEKLLELTNEKGTI